jgi:hypothetical protein
MPGHGVQVPLALGMPLLLACNAVLGIDAPIEDRHSQDMDGVIILTDDSGADDGEDGDPQDRDAGAQGASTAPPTKPDPLAWPSWPMPNPKTNGLPNPQSYAAREEGVVTDKVTGLQWEQTVDGSQYTWEDAANYCDQLDTAGGGFRLPKRIELLSLVDFTHPNPSIDVSAFPDSPAGKFWTASRFAGTRTGAWAVDFSFSTSFALVSQQSEKLWVRCVR